MSFGKPNAILRGNGRNIFWKHGSKEPMLYLKMNEKDKSFTLVVEQRSKVRFQTKLKGFSYGEDEFHVKFEENAFVLSKGKESQRITLCFLKRVLNLS